MILFATGVSAAVSALLHSTPIADGDYEFGRHPGQNGKLTEQQLQMARGAWRYFENNYQPSSCLVNSVDRYPSTTLWDLASSIAATVAAFELDFIDAPTFDHRMGCMLATLTRLPLYEGELPNKAYHTVTMEAVDYDNRPGEIGFSALDLGRLLTWLGIVKTRYPRHADAADRVVLRWNFCNVVDRAGALHGAARSEGSDSLYLQEGRLGYEEYAAKGFQIWDFDTTQASSLEPFEETKIAGVKIAYDGRDPEEFGAHTYVLTESYMLDGIELNWDLIGDVEPSDMWHSDRKGRQLAKRVYRAQVRRWRRTGQLTARTEHHVDGPPYFVYDTVFSDGEPWITIAEDGARHPELATVSTKAAVGMWVLFDTRYTDQLVASLLPILDEERGWPEGYLERNGQPLEAITANTNGIVLEALLYKLQGKLYRDHGLETLWDHVPNGEFPGYWQCLPRERAPEAPTHGAYEISDQGRRRVEWEE